MSTTPERPTTTKAPQQAVQEYLDALLQEATRPAPPPVAAPTPKRPAGKAAPAPRTAPETLQRSPQPAVAEVAEVVVEADPSGWRNGRPAWAQEQFECLLFRVAGLTLAVPLVELGGVVTLDRPLTPLFGQPDWFLGLLPGHGNGTINAAAIKTIDTARWVMPEKYSEDAREGLRYVIRLQGSEWGMACHEVADAISLKPDQVRWRTDRSRRPWLAGTVIDHMCAIIDVPALARLLREAQASSGKKPV